MKKEDFDPLYYNVCPQCGLTATSVVDTEQNLRRGWYCEHCTHFNEAIGRERLLRKSPTVLTPEEIDDLVNGIGENNGG